MKLEDRAPEQETEGDDMERCAPADGGGPAQGEEEKIWRKYGEEC